MTGDGSFLQEYQKNYFFRVSDYVLQLLSFSPKNYRKKGLIVATLMIRGKFKSFVQTPYPLSRVSYHTQAVGMGRVRVE